MISVGNALNSIATLRKRTVGKRIALEWHSKEPYCIGIEALVYAMDKQGEELERQRAQ